MAPAALAWHGAAHAHPLARPQPGRPPPPARRYNRFKGASNLDELNKLLTAVAMIRRRKSEVGNQLPPKSRQQVGD